MIRRTAFTLVELLIVIAIVGILTALLLPAVQSARGAARRMNCASNSKQIVLALGMHADVHATLPPGTGGSLGPRPYQGWFALLLPYLEQQAVYSEMEKSFAARRFPFGSVNHLHVGTSIRAFGCPEDSRSLQAIVSRAHGFMVGTTSFQGVNGENRAKCNGVFYYDSSIRYADVTDGLSNTFAFGERPISPGHDLGWWYAGVGIDGRGTGDHTLGSIEVGPSQYSGHGACGNGPFAFGPGTITNECDALHFWSLHAGRGAHFASLDGAVRFVPYSGGGVLRALSTRANAEIVSAP